MYVYRKESSLIINVDKCAIKRTDTAIEAIPYSGGAKILLKNCASVDEACSLMDRIVHYIRLDADILEL